MFRCPSHASGFGCRAGVVESVLARVMDAFQVRMQGALLAASVKTLSESPAVARLMAAEPAAPQAGSPVAFFTGRHTDSVDAFVTDVLNNTGAARIAGQTWLIPRKLALPCRACSDISAATSRHNDGASFPSQASRLPMNSMRCLTCRLRQRRRGRGGRPAGEAGPRASRTLGAPVELGRQASRPTVETLTTTFSADTYSAVLCII